MRDLPAPSISHPTRAPWLERILLVGGTAALACYAAATIDSAVTQRLARQSLTVARLSGERVASASAVAPDIRPAIVAVPRGDPVAALTIPRVALSASVLQGSDTRTLRRGPGHLERTALPGQPGNVVIAGHRDSFFRPLQHVRVGDDIFLDSPAGRFHYRVTTLDIVDPHDRGVTAPTPEAALTLFTCYPFWVLGNAPQRFVVRATPVADGLLPERPDEPHPREQFRAFAGAQAEGRPRAAAPVRSDEQLLRRAVERYLHAYNFRLQHREHASSSLLPGSPRCAVTIGDDAATASCVTTTSAGLTDARTFSLERTPHGWAIRAIVVTDD